MMQRYNKALAAAAVCVAAIIGVNVPEEVLTAIAAVLVYAVPNRA